MSQQKRVTPKRSRPTMPDFSAGEEGMLTWDWVDKRMAEARNYWICSTRPDGRPHARPVWGVWFEGTLYFSTHRQSHNARNLTRNPEVAMHLESGDETVIFEGVVEEVTDSTIFTGMADAYQAKYPPIRPELNPAQVTYAIKPRVVFAWTESDFEKTPTRWQFGE